MTDEFEFDADDSFEPLEAKQVVRDYACGVCYVSVSSSDRVVMQVHECRMECKTLEFQYPHRIGW